MDKSSIFRTLTLFIEYDVVHTFEDGRGIVNYELCGEKENVITMTITSISTVSHASAPSALTV